MKSITIAGASITPKYNCIEINIPDSSELKDVKIIDAKLKAIANPTYENKNYNVNFYANEEYQWSNIEFLKEVKNSDSLMIDVSDELQTTIAQESKTFKINFVGDTISFSDCELLIDYISLSEYQTNGSSHKIDLGKDGNASVELSTGNLSASFPIVNSDNKPLPLSITATYNSVINEKLSDKNIGLPDNWHLNLNQFLIKEETEDGSLTFTFIDENGKNQIIEEKYSYTNANGDKKYAFRKTNIDEIASGEAVVIVNLDGEYVAKEKTISEDGTITYNEYPITTELVAPSGLKLVSSISDIEGADLVDYEPEELINVKRQISQLKETINDLENSIKLNKKQLCLYALSKEMFNNQLYKQEQSLLDTENQLKLQEIIEQIKKDTLSYNRNYRLTTNDDSPDKPKDDATAEGIFAPGENIDFSGLKNLYESDTKNVVAGSILASESSLIYSFGIQSEDAEINIINSESEEELSFNKYEGTIKSQYETNKFNKSLYSNSIELSDFKGFVTKILTCYPDIQISDEIEDLYKDILYNTNVNDDNQKTKLVFGYKDLISIDIQIESAANNLIKYNSNLNKYRKELEKYKHQQKLYEQQVPVHYLYNDSNVIYGFGKTYEVINEEEKETDTYRLILITDAYENTIFISYESLTSNKITSITDSAEKITSFSYSEDKGFLQDIIDSQDRKTSFEYEKTNGYIQSIKGKNADVSFNYKIIDGKDKILLEDIVGRSKIGARFTYDENNGKVVKIEKISYLQEININTKVDQVLSNPNVIENEQVSFSYDNYKSTTLTNSKDKKITYLFDKYGKVRTVYENDFTITTSENGTSLCESEPIFRSNVTDFNYQDKNTLLKVTKLPYSTNYLENINFDNSIVQQACSQDESAEYSNLYLGSDLICGDDAVPYSYVVYHNHYKFRDANSSASLSLEKTADSNPFSFLEESCHKMLVLSCWAKADSAFIVTDENSENYSSNCKDRKFELRAEVLYTGEEAVKPISQSFDWRNTNWQYCCLPIELESSNIEKITFYIDYSDNTNTSSFEFTKPELKLGDFEKTEYSEDKTKVNITTGHSEWEKELNYNDKQQLISETIKRVYVKEGTTNEFTTTYEYSKTGKLIKSTDFYGIVKESVYNDKGSVVKTLTYHKDEPANILVEENIINDKGETTEEVNEFGEKVLQYEYKDGTNIVTTQIDSNGNKTSFGYDDSDNLVEKTTFVDGEDNTTLYGYTLDFLTSLKHNNFEVNYNYYSNGKLKEVYIAGFRYLTKVYNENEEITYLENGESCKTIYNDDGKILQVYYKKDQQTEDWTLTVQNIYDIYGNLIFAEDKITNDLNKYFIDSFGNTYKEESTQHSESIDIENEYDKYHSNITKTSVSFGNNKSTKLIYDYTMSDTPDAKLLNVNINKGENSTTNIVKQKVNYDKLNRIDNFSRLIPSTDRTLSNQFIYLKQGNHTSNIISKINYSNDGIINDRLSYKYDKNGNIIEIREQGQLLARYKYDSLSRLIREDNKEFEKTITFEYDGGGNILCKKLYNFTLVDNLEFESANEIIPYTYPIDGWRDQLKQFNGKEIKNYDELGNPWHYRGNELLWSHGRQLDKFGDISTYTYNSNGIRTSKITYGFTTKFYLTGNKIIRQYDHINDMYFYYGADGLTGFNLNGTDYYYKKNAQNDIIGIYSTDGTQICKYFYDAWGNQVVKYLNSSGEYVTIEAGYQYNDTSITNRFVAYKNPFRYRSYYYDFETGLYYLNSRYYDPELGRYINADDISVLESTKEVHNGLNLYAYCLNNPVNTSDDNGDIPNWLKWLLGALIIIVLAVATVFSGGTAGVLFGAALYSSVTTAVSSAIIGGIIGGITGGWQGFWNGLSDGFFSGAVLGMATGFLSAGLNIAFKGVQIVGSAQKTGSLFHQFASNVQAGKMSLAIGRYSKIYLNRSKGLGLSGYRPDVTGVTKNGLRIVEVVSSTQTYTSQVAKVGKMMNQYSHILHGVTIDGLRFITKWFVF